MADINLTIGIDEAKTSTADLQASINKIIDSLEPAKIKIEINEASAENVKSTIKSIQAEIDKLGTEKILLNIDQGITSSIQKIDQNVDALASSLKEISNGGNMSGVQQVFETINSSVESLKSNVSELTQAMSNFNGVTIKMGSSSSPVKLNAEYGQSARSTIASLQEQRTALEEYLATYTRVSDGVQAALNVIKEASFGTEGSGNLLNSVYDLYGKMESGSLKSQMSAFQQYINIITEAAKIQGIDITPVTSGFSQTANQMVSDTTKILTGEKELEKQSQQLSNIFGSVNGEALTKDLTEIKTAIDNVVEAINNLKPNTEQITKFTEAITNALTELSKLQSTVQTLQQDSGVQGSVDTSGVDQQIAAQKELASAEEEAASAAQSAASTTASANSQAASSTENLQQQVKATANVESELATSAQQAATSEQTQAKAATENANAHKTYQNALNTINAALQKYSSAQDSADASVQSSYNNLIAQKDALNQCYTAYQNGTSSYQGFSNAAKEVSTSVSASTSSLQLAANAAKANATAEKESASASKAYQTTLNTINTALQKYASAQDSANTAAQSSYNNLSAQKTALEQCYSAYQNGTTSYQAYKNAITDINTAISESKSNLQLAANAAKEEASANAEAAAEATNLAKQELSKEQVLSQTATTLDRLKTALLNYSQAENSSNASSREAYQAISAQVTAVEKAEAKYLKTTESVTDYTKANTALKRTLAEANTVLTKSKTVLKENGDATKSLSDRITNLVSRFATMMSTYQVLMYVVRGMKELISTSIELDDAMTQLRIVTDETEASYEEYANTISKTAQEVASSIADLTDSTTTYARLGYDLEDSSYMAELTAMLQNVGKRIA